MPNDPKEVLYFVQPGDSLTKIARIKLGFGPQPRVEDRIKELLQLNPHIKDPNFLMAGEPIRLLKPAGIPYDVSSLSMSEVRNVWLKASPEERRIVQSNFDILEWLALSKNVGEYLDTMGEETQAVLESVAEYKFTGSFSAEVLRVSRLYKNLLIVRQGTVAFVQQMQISVIRQPIIILSYTRNGLYDLSQRLLRVVDMAERFNSGRKLFYLEVGIETVKVGKVAVQTRSVGETAKQAGRGAATIAMGTLGNKMGRQICRVSLKMSNKVAGIVICGVSLAATTYGGAKLGNRVGKYLFGPPIEAELPKLQ